MGTTSACAENTAKNTGLPLRPRNYLRVRGEYLAISLAAYTMLELPPRARRILPVRGQPVVTPGTTSACAENTLAIPIIDPYHWNYLRVRGEYIAKPNWSYICLELPPRARRIPI